ncbi:hypothetical protein KC318_g3469 [Hortaea werneckii]|nr:hypothetical protein KC334_g4025 [Hortaea werneckii]KAI7015687.1 hypothetical protein KC355_g4263 [Hortaea werneckii]KAI7200464.1 hypothetical protein KC324_g2698 [Hortaea werneckii]KAI7592962.1 hypothetical protein KC316_g2016 [Hortaea werneckii]KAI7671482.1 hypothetical protein KC318_g3469 [Hortaea werneckii]
MGAPPDYPWCYTCITRGYSSCDMIQRHPDPCTNCQIYFRNTNKKITCKRSGLTTEEWAEKKAIEAQKLQQNANPMFQFGQAQQGQMPLPMFSPQLGQAASFFPNMYQPQQWFGNMMDTSDNSYPQQQQLPGSFPMSTSQLSAGAFGQKPSGNTLRARRKRANARRSREEEMAANLAETQERLDDAERKLAAAARERERGREDERRVRRWIDDENKNLKSSLRQEQEKSAGLRRDLKINRNLKHEAQKQHKDLRKQENVRGFENQLNDMPRSTPAQHGPSQHYNPIMGSTSPQNYYPTYGQQAYGGQQNPYQMPQGYPPPMHYPAHPPMQRQPRGYDQPPPAGNMHHPMQSTMQYPTEQPMNPPHGGHQQSPPAGDQQRQGYHGVEQRDYAQPPPGPLPTPTAASSPVQMQQQMQSDSEGAPRASGEDWEARKKRAME